MSERYFVTGVQLGMMLAFLQFNKLDKVKEIIEEIEEKQFMGRIPSSDV